MYGNVSEGSGQNIFIVRRGQLFTPPLSASVLRGITRDAILTLAHDLGFAVVETNLPRESLYVADEVLVCGTAAEVLGVAEIDRRTIGAGRPGPVTTKLLQAYRDAVRGRHQRSEEWLTYV